MLEKIAEHLKTTSRQPALCIEGQMTSYGKLALRVVTIQRAIEAHALLPQSIVALWADNSVDTYASMLALLFAGHAYLPLNPTGPVGRNASVLAESGARIMLSTDASLCQAVADAAGAVKVLETARLDVGAGDPVMRDVPASANSYLLFTSGSTGTPKGVPITRGNLDAFLESLFASGLSMGAQDRVLQMFDLTFDFSVMSCFAPWVVGASIYTTSTRELRLMSVLKLLTGSGITVAPMVPSALAFMRPFFEEINLHELRFSVFCGEALLEDITREWSGCTPNSRIINYYGPTEATVFCSYYEWTPATSKSHNGALSIGRPMRHCEMAVISDHGEVLGDDVAGEICLAGAQLTVGYFNDPERNARAFLDLAVNGGVRRFYRTGDIGWRDAEGDYLFQGRADQQVKVNGFRIELGEIEHHARLIEGIGQVVVVVVPGGGGASELVLCVSQGSADHRLTESVLRTRLPAYMVPSRTMSFDALPLNANGKIDRPRLTVLATARRRALA